MQDGSRPEGWGDDRLAAGASRPLYSGGEAYVAEAMVKGTFAMAETKSAAYAEALRALMADLVAALADPNHRLRVTLEDGIASLEIALHATEQAHRVAG